MKTKNRADRTSVVIMTEKQLAPAAAAAGGGGGSGGGSAGAQGGGGGRGGGVPQGVARFELERERKRVVEFQVCAVLCLLGCAGSCCAQEAGCMKACRPCRIVCGSSGRARQDVSSWGGTLVALSNAN